ncbi:MAG: LysM peptidoglycan-binding domain-containing protein, partial [Clostridia bacterium]|nr:LysM peptidoglycan-binding domain-containing protein [Clostridia bacterium]
WGSEEVVGVSGQNLFALTASGLTERKLPNFIGDLAKVGKQQVVLAARSEWSIWEWRREGWHQLQKQEETEENFQSVAFGAGLLAVASGSRFYLYSWSKTKTELLAIRETCGTIQKMFFWSEAENLLVVLAKNSRGSCLELLRLTEQGIQAVALKEGISGDVLGQFEAYLLVGGPDGRVRIYAWKKGQVQEVLTTEILGTRITALTAWGKNWAAATPGGYVFIFSGLNSQPESVIYFVQPISGLSWLNQEKIAVGLSNGWLELAYWYPPADFYTVREADTLWSIAQALGLELKDLIVRNGLEENNLLKPGQILKLRH